MTKRTLAAVAAAALIAVGCASSPDDDKAPIRPVRPVVSEAPKGKPTVTATKKPKAKKSPEAARPRKTAKKSTPEVTAESYSNCAAMRRDYPNGVPAGHGSYSRRLDRDRDGRACER